MDEATDIKIQELVDKIERGEIRLPEMQRQYVWKKTHVRDLLDSLYRGYPSGSILTWKPDVDLGARPFAVAQKKTDGQYFEYLLDGQQRLTSLSSLLRGEPVTMRGNTKPIDILFNLDHPDMPEEGMDGDISSSEASESELMQHLKKMTFVVYDKKLAKQPGWVSVTEALKDKKRDEILKKMKIERIDDPLQKKYSDRLIRLCKIKDYTYRVHRLGSKKSHAEVANIFVRVNSLGVKLRSSDLALALITTKWKGASNIFESFEEKCKKRGFDFGGPEIILRTLVTFATGQAKFDAIGKLSEEELKNTWEETKEGMFFALDFLRDSAKINSRVLMSSPFLVPVLALYVQKRDKMSPSERHALQRWALMANVKARYSRGSSETILNEDLAMIRDNEGIGELMNRLKRQVGRLEVEPDDLAQKEKNSPYFKAMFMAFRAAGAHDWQRMPISIDNTGAKHALQAHHIFPLALLERHGVSKKQINDICNFAFISGTANRQIKDRAPENYLPTDVVDKFGEDELKKQCIPTNRALWKVSAYDDFLAKRRELIAKRLNEFLKQE